MGIFTRRNTSAPVELSSPSAPGADSARGQQFEVNVPPSFFGLTSYSDPVAAVSKISRSAAISVPAVKKGRDIVCGLVGGLPYGLLNADFEKTPSAFLEQPEASTTCVNTFMNTVDDLLMHGRAWWQVTAFDWKGYPSRIVRLDPTSVSVNSEGRVYVTRAGNTGHTVEFLEDAELIRFDSPHDALLSTAARAISTCLKLDAAASANAEDPLPTIYFTPADGADVLDQEEVTGFLANWRTARKARGSAFLNNAVQLHTITPLTAEQMQLAESRQHAVLEIARAFPGVDPEDLGVSTTSRTYFNAFDRKQAQLQALRPLISSIEQRLSMPDVTPRGYTVRADLSDLLRSSDQERYAAYATALQVGALTRPEIRELEHRAPLDDDQTGTPEPEPTAPETPEAPDA